METGSPQKNATDAGQVSTARADRPAQNARTEAPLIDTKRREPNGRMPS